MTDPNRTAYVAALRALARRELSEAQVRRHLGKQGHPKDSIDLAIDRLKEERAIDDARVAEAIARTETSFKRRGRVRVQHQIERAGIASTVAKRVVSETFSGLDADMLLETALDKRLHGRERLADDREVRRLYRHLIGQGFEAERVVKAIARRRPK